MKINKIYIQEGKLYINLDSSNNVTKIYLDKITNKDNVLSDNNEDHCEVITENLGNKSEFTLDLQDIEQAYIVTIIGDTKEIGFALDEESLYKDKVSLLTSFCNTCLDKLSKERIIMCEFRNNLLDYAIQNNLINDAISHYCDLHRLLKQTNEFNCNNCFDYE